MKIAFDSTVADGIEVEVKGEFEPVDKACGFSGGFEVKRVCIITDMASTNILSLISKLDIQLLEAKGWEVGLADARETKKYRQTIQQQRGI